MLAARLHAFDDLRIDTVPDPAVARDEVLLRVVCVQPSITEAMLIIGEHVALHDSLQSRLRETGPLAFGGHEFAATVEAVGSDVENYRIGDHVTAAETITCGSCPYCRLRRGAVCASPEFLGFTRPGAFAELLAVPAANLVPLPASMTPAQAAALQPLVGAIHAQSAANVEPGESVLVLGTGVMGLLAVQLARRCGAGLVVATGRSDTKRRWAERFGADVVIDSRQADIPARARDLTDGVGFDVVVETAGGSPAVGLSGAKTIGDAAGAARYGGRIVIVSVLEDGETLPLAQIRSKALTLLHPASGRFCGTSATDAFELAVRYVERGDIDVDSVITHRLNGLHELPRALDIVSNKSIFGAINPPQIDIGSQW